MKVRIGEFAFDADARMIYGAGRAHRLGRKSSAVLALLARAPGETVRLQELLDAVWPDGGTEEAVAEAIASVRAALGFSARDYIQAGPTGYRLAAEVEPYAAMRAAALDKSAPRRTAHPALWVSLAALAVASLGLAFSVSGRSPVADVKHEQISSARP